MNDVSCFRGAEFQQNLIAITRKIDRTGIGKNKLRHGGDVVPLGGESILLLGGRADKKRDPEIGIACDQDRIDDALNLGRILLHRVRGRSLAGRLGVGFLRYAGRAAGEKSEGEKQT